MYKLTFIRFLVMVKLDEVCASPTSHQDALIDKCGEQDPNYNLFRKKFLGVQKLLLELRSYQQAANYSQQYYFVILDAGNRTRTTTFLEKSF